MISQLSIKFSTIALTGLLVWVTPCCAPEYYPDPVVTGIVTDADGNKYATVKIGSQWWMAENLRTTRYRNGDSIAEIAGSELWTDSETGACCVYGNDTSHIRVFGRLYNGYAVSDVRQLAPSGWHIPTDEEWERLIAFLGGTQTAGGRLKEEGTQHWAYPNTGASNEAGFYATGSGYRNNLSGAFAGMGQTGIWWSASHDGVAEPLIWVRELLYNNTSVARHSSSLQYGYAVRCVKD